MKRIKTLLKGLPMVENFCSPRSGREVANQFKIYFDNGVLFQSYSTIIAVKFNDGRIVLDRQKWDYSATTGKYRNEFLGVNIAETRKLIESGSFVLADLNQ